MSKTTSPASAGIGSSSVFLISFICGVGLSVGLWAAHSLYSFNFVSYPSQILRLAWLVEAPIVILLYSSLRLNPDRCSYLKAVLRGLLGLPVGAFINAFGAIVLGAPIGIQYLPKTIHWSLLMSLFTFAPAASVFGSCWADWHRIYALTKPNRPLEYMICIPAYGAVIGAWFGAWPMPLDWDRPWQEWPICVSYCAIIGYLVGLVASWGVSIIHNRRHHYKGD